MQNNYYNPQSQNPTEHQYPEHLVAHVSQIHKNCVGYMKKKVKIVTIDQQVYKGTIDHVDNMHVYLLFDDDYREEPSNQENNLRYGYGYGSGPGYGFGPGFGVGPGYGYGVGPGFGAGIGGAILPLFALAAVSAIR